MMAFGAFGSAASHHAMSEINMVPLIDVVLVLLVLFILAAPMSVQSVRIKLPSTAHAPSADEVRSIDLQLRSDGVTLNQAGERVDVSSLASASAVHGAPTPIVRIWSDQDSRYEHLAKLIAELKGMGFLKISLMSRAQAGSK